MAKTRVTPREKYIKSLMKTYGMNRKMAQTVADSSSSGKFRVVRNPSPASLLPLTWKKAQVRRLPGGQVQIKVSGGRRGNPGMGTYYTITRSNVGKRAITAFGRRWPVEDFIGHIGKYDVGKRVYLRGNILQVENDQQLAARIGRRGR
jgi:hypothetical protein